MNLGGDVAKQPKVPKIAATVPPPLPSVAKSIPKGLRGKLLQLVVRGKDEQAAAEAGGGDGSVMVVGGGPNTHKMRRMVSRQKGKSARAAEKAKALRDKAVGDSKKRVGEDASFKGDARSTAAAVARAASQAIDEAAKQAEATTAPIQTGGEGPPP